METVASEEIKEIATKKNTNNSVHQILLQNQKNLTMTGISRVDNSNENGIAVMVGETPLEVVGTNLHISKLDVEKGVVELDGNILTIKYNQKSKGNFVKRLFK